MIFIFTNPIDGEMKRMKERWQELCILGRDVTSSVIVVIEVIWLCSLRRGSFTWELKTRIQIGFKSRPDG